MVMMAGVDGGTLLHRFWFTLLSSTLFSGGGGGFRVGDWGSFPFFICPYHSSSSSSRRRGSSMQKKEITGLLLEAFPGMFWEGKNEIIFRNGSGAGTGKGGSSAGAFRFPAKRTF